MEVVIRVGHVQAGVQHLVMYADKSCSCVHFVLGQQRQPCLCPIFVIFNGKCGDDCCCLSTACENQRVVQLDQQLFLHLFSRRIFVFQVEDLGFVATSGLVLQLQGLDSVAVSGLGHCIKQVEFFS